MSMIRCYNCEGNIDSDFVDFEFINGHHYCPDCLDSKRYILDLAIQAISDSVPENIKKLVELREKYPLSCDDPDYQAYCRSNDTFPKRGK